MKTTAPLKYDTQKRLEEIKNGFSVLLIDVGRRHSIEPPNVTLATLWGQVSLGELPHNLSEEVKTEIRTGFQSL